MLDFIILVLMGRRRGRRIISIFSPFLSIIFLSSIVTVNAAAFSSPLSSPPSIIIRTRDIKQRKQSEKKLFLRPSYHHHSLTSSYYHHSPSCLELFRGGKKHNNDYHNSRKQHRDNNNGGIINNNGVNKLYWLPSQGKRSNNNNNNKREKRIKQRKIVWFWRAVQQRIRSIVYRNTVYILQCKEDKYYVGSTRNRKQRYRQHFRNSRGGSKWTRMYKPIRVIKEYKRIPTKYLMGMESQITAECMMKYGVNNVRGAMYCTSRPFTTYDVSELTGFLGHYNQLNYQELYNELLLVLPKGKRYKDNNDRFSPTIRAKFTVTNNNNKEEREEAEGETTIDDDDDEKAAAAAKIMRRKTRNYKRKQRRKRQNFRKRKMKERLNKVSSWSLEGGGGDNDDETLLLLNNNNNNDDNDDKLHNSNDKSNNDDMPDSASPNTITTTTTPERADVYNNDEKIETAITDG